MRGSVAAAGSGEAMARIGTSLAVPAVLQDLGASPAKVIADAGFDLTLFDNPENQISYRARGRLQSKYGGTSVQELERLKELEAENAKLKRMYAELALENTAIRDLLGRKR